MKTYFKKILPTYIEKWPSILTRLSIAQKDIPIDRDTAIVLGYSNNKDLFGEYEKCLTVDKNRMIKNLSTKIDKHIKEFPNGVFVRLGSRSPKDSWIGNKEGFKILEGVSAIKLLIDSERVAEDLKLALDNNYLSHIFLRQWIEIKPWQEFRCFMQNKKLIGISQYNYLDNEEFKEIIEYKDSITWAIELFFKKFVQACHLDNVVFDVIVILKQIKNEIQWEIKLLEINPFLNMTDPCLFDWNKPNEFNGTLKYNLKF